MKRPPVTIVIPDPTVNRCPRQIAQHRGGCYCMTYICCGELSPEPHADDCGGLLIVHESGGAHFDEAAYKALNS